MNCNKITPFSEYIKIEIKTFIDTYNITANIYRIQEHDSIMCEYVCIGSIDFILNKKDYYVLLICSFCKILEKLLNNTLKFSITQNKHLVQQNYITAQNLTNISVNFVVGVLESNIVHSEHLLFIISNCNVWKTYTKSLTKRSQKDIKSTV